MRIAAMLIFGIVVTLTAGCATEVQQAQAPLPMPRPYAPATAAALAFDPPVLGYAPVPTFDRTGRAPSAFYGYEQTTTDALYIYQRDSLRGDPYPDYFDRTTRASRATTTYR